LALRLLRRRDAICRHDKNSPRAYMGSMRKVLLFTPLFVLLIASFLFAGSAFVRLGANIPLYGWIAIAGGVGFSILVGGGLMALVFYSSRHGYDDLSRDSDEDAPPL
jgi:hypothetical protein